MASFDLADFAGYRRFLAASAAALLPLEAALVHAGVAARFPDWKTRSRSAAIVTDLARLGGGLPQQVPVAPLTPAGLLGTMYVLEGSRLGAKFLLRIVAASADPRVVAATAYLGHGAGQRLWQSLLSEFDGADIGDDDEAIAAARGAFAAFQQAADRA